MITKELIERINQLARKQRSEGLTDEERAEQQKLRKSYLAGFRENMKNVLDQIEIVDVPPRDNNKLN
ncbi:MAG: DUF896 domain-containing protein [Selenomonadales bacterium]|nr:DUF896 domain-containing protein [Selenomonadales bacterium]MDD6218657.1 DUF896 domain-containing protein [Selenomonadaceae bacterium]